MDSKRLFIVMMGLPARGKSTLANKLKENLVRDSIKTRIFNNGDLRRRLIKKDTSYPEFYDPDNYEAATFREKIALININRAKKFLEHGGDVAILDATHVSRKRRQRVIGLLKDHPILFIECVNMDPMILEASIERKTTLPEFTHLSKAEARKSFKERIRYYERIYSPLSKETNYVRLDTLNNRIEEEEIKGSIPFYDRLRDFLVTDSVKNLFLIRHGETYFNLENRIGGDSSLTETGVAQARALSKTFSSRKIPFIFTSEKKRTIQTAEPIKALQSKCSIIGLKEFNEIDSGVCECMSYEEINRKMPEIYHARKLDKYNYIYPQGEGYVSMKKRVYLGIKKALYLSGNASNIMIIGHRAVNRMILSHFLYKRQEDVPYIYVPQDKFYHVVATQDKKLFQLKAYDI